MDYNVEFKEKIDKARMECITTIMGCHRKMMYGKLEIPHYLGTKEKDKMMSTTVMTEIDKLLNIIL